MERFPGRFHHFGVPTENPRPNESFLPDYGTHVTDHWDNPFGIQWMRFDEGSPLPEVVRSVPHLAYEVDDLLSALEGRDVLIPPNSPSEGVRVAFIVHDGIPIEFLEFTGEHPDRLPPRGAAEGGKNV